MEKGWGRREEGETRRFDDGFPTSDNLHHPALSMGRRVMRPIWPSSSPPPMMSSSSSFFFRFSALQEGR
jgi:hypothetical protein